MTIWDDLLQDAEDLDDDDDLDDEDLDDEDLDDDEFEDLDDLAGVDLGDGDGDESGTGGGRVLVIDDEDDDEDADPSGDDLERSVYVNCPYCGREVEHMVDPGGGSHQVYIEDCEVCCQPWEVTVRIEDGIPWAVARALDE